MNKFFRTVGFGLVALLMPTAVSAFPLNAKKAPESQEDLALIQEALQSALPQAKAATVCVDLGEGTGSGVIVSKDGLVMTAAHVSTAVGKKVTIIMPDGTKLDAITLGLVASSDAALIQITEEGDYPFVELNRLSAPELGDWIFSVGHSGGFDEDRGAVVRLARLVRIANSTFQTDGTLIGGDSGGPLFDMEGRLIGIHSRVGPQLPVNMHVPVEVFLDNWDAMKASEFIGEGPFAQKPIKGTGFLGLLSEGNEKGLEVVRIGQETPAEKAGLEVGDLIRSLNGVEVKTRDELKAVLAEMATGQELEIEITRDGKDQKISLELGKR